MTNYPTDPADILEAAADLLESTGWTKGAYHRNMYNDSDDGDAQNAVSYCAAGAIRRAAGWYDHHSVPMARGTMDIEAMLAEKVGVICLPSWNDKPERKVHEVIDLLKETAKDLRNRKAAA